MDKTDVRLLEEEGQELTKSVGLIDDDSTDSNDNEQTPDISELQKAIVHAIQAEITKQVLEKKLSTKQVEIINNPRVVVEFPSLQKVFGEMKIDGPVEAKVTFPKVQEVKGKVEADVQFPDIQKIAGIVEALVKFPDVQKITGIVEALVKFPELQKVVGDMNVTNLPVAEGAEASIARANPTRYIPVRLSNGKRFYDLFETIAKSVSTGHKTSSLDIPPHDYRTFLYPDSVTEQIFCRVGGANGNVVAILTIGYTSASKEKISYIQKV
jgi:hypothetical protein